MRTGISSRVGGWMAAASAVALAPLPHGLAQSALTSAPTSAPATVPATVPATSPSDALAALVQTLGDPDYRNREAATRAILARGPAAVGELRAWLPKTTDPEARRRLDYILEVITPPQAAVMICRAPAASGLHAADLIVQANGRRVRDVLELHRRIPDFKDGAALRVLTVDGPQEPVLDSLEAFTLANYRAPRGDAIVQALREYSAGDPERAVEILDALPELPPPAELAPDLWARMLYTAGHGARAMQLLDPLGPTLALQAGSGNEWTGLSQLDACGPGKAPFHLEWQLLTNGGASAYGAQIDPDLRVQRVLVPAGRHIDAFTRDAELWWARYRYALSTPDEQLVAGNLLAVIAWMCSELELRSECCRLVEPRSEFLRRSPGGETKWVRVETDAWLPFFAGDPAAALNEFYDAAVAILRRPPQPDERNALIRNPAIAGRIGFFLYQLPGDTRADEVIKDLMHPQHPALLPYLDAMLHGVNEANQERITQHLGQLLAFVPDERVAPYARAMVLLQYVQATPELEAMQAARARVVAAPASGDRALTLAQLDAMIALAAHQPAEALGHLEPFAGRREVAGLSATARFLQSPPAGVDANAALRDPILAIPLGHGDQTWAIVTRQRQLARFEAATGKLTPLERPSPAWVPGPLNWPWLGRQEATGRVWAYGLRRIAELNPPAGRTALRCNISPTLIRLFDTALGDEFERFAEDVLGGSAPSGETGDFLRADLKSGLDYANDPDLPELAFVTPLAGLPGYWHVAMRGGPSWLIDRTRRKMQSSLQIADAAGLGPDLRFFPILPPPEASESDGSTGSIWLASSAGLLRFESRSGDVRRVPLPGAEPNPPLIPESTPCVRRDPRWIYLARLPEDGGQVYRLNLQDETIAAVDMINEALPPDYYRGQSRAALRAELTRRLEKIGVPSLGELIRDAIERVRVAAPGEAK